MSVELSVILPAYLEEENLRVLLPRLKAVLTGLTPSYEILILDTVTPLDKTREVCEQNGVAYTPREGGNMFGDAVRTGIKKASGKYLLFMDADGSHTPEFIPEIYKHRESYDVVIASRYIEGGYTENSSSLIWMSRLLNFTYSFVLNLKCKDVSNSFKIYRGDLIKRVDLYCDNFDIVEEVLYKMSRLKKDFKIKEVPFTFKKRMFGETKRNLFVFILTYLVTIVRLRFGLTGKK